MTEMIERVARAIAETIAMAQIRHNLREIGQEDQIENYLKAFPLKVTLVDTDAARAAIAAMREPTKAMAQEAWGLSVTVDRDGGAWLSDDAGIELWRAMIDAALKEPACSPVED